MPPTHRAALRRKVPRWFAAGLVLAALHAMWSVTIPLMASPDEPSHVVRAAAVARGQWSGELGPPPVDGSRPGTGTVVQLPSDYAELITLPNCIAFQPDEPASCQPVVHPPTGSLVPVETFAGQYPPLYYALVGWPSLLWHAEASTYAMRLLSGVLASAFLLWGVAGLRRSTLPAPAVWGCLVAVTPMTLFLGATVNPQALEIASAFAFWSACIALVAAPGRPATSTLVQAAVAGAVLVNARASGPVWALAAITIALVLAPHGRLRELWAARGVRWVLGVGLTSGLVATAWVATHGGVVSGHGLFPQYASPFAAARAILGFSHGYLLQMIGNFGWLDAPSPPVTTELWFVATGALLLLGLAAPVRRRARVALALAALIVVAAPFALQIPTAGDTGIIWQGRYALPVAVGVPLVAAAVLTEAALPVRDLVARAGRWVLAAVGVAHVAAFWWAMRRYADGLDGEVVTTTPQWSSPLGYLPAVALYAALVVVAGTIAWRAARRVPQPQDDPSLVG